MTNPNRTERILLRATPGEKTVMLERAAANGMNLSAWVRQAAMEGTVPAVQRVPSVEPPAPSPTEDAELDRRTRNLARLMPRKTAEQVAKKELARERARAAISG